MNQLNNEKLALKLSASILLKNKSISISEIRSLPFLDEDFDHTPIVDALVKSFNAKIRQQKKCETPFLEWEELITI